MFPLYTAIISASSSIHVSTIDAEVRGGEYDVATVHYAAYSRSSFPIFSRQEPDLNWEGNMVDQKSKPVAVWPQLKSSYGTSGLLAACIIQHIDITEVIESRVRYF